MSINYDEKGKYFTEVVPKDHLRAVIQTTSHRLHGTIHVSHGERILDELNRSISFIAVTDVTIYSLSGELLYRREFLSLNRDHIVWIIPEGDLSSQPEAGVD
jgi:hypothetical protein